MIISVPGCAPLGVRQQRQTIYLNASNVNMARIGMRLVCATAISSTPAAAGCCSRIAAALAAAAARPVALLSAASACAAARCSSRLVPLLLLLVCADGMRTQIYVQRLRQNACSRALIIRGLRRGMRQTKNDRMCQ